MVIYLDAFMGLNFLVDLCLLLGVNRLSGHPPGLPRAAAAAALGGGYAGVCLIPGFQFLGSGLWRAVSLGLMGWTAFGADRSGWQRSMLFVMLSMALGGMAMSMSSGGLGLAVSVGALALIGKMGLRGQGRRFVDVTVTYGGQTVQLRALVDTGNSLCDPITGEPVTVLSPGIGLRLGIPPEALADPGGSMLPGLRLIPARTIGGGGLLAAVRCERVTIGGRKGGRVVAFARENFGNGEYQALTGGCYG
ncbi:MAG: sigma-E processing peptidase SpoIIGA [Oscillospiraceae bacterium]|nr:sigma-E processing peptidase SpoIIGA [Oscillospiraceae bacterium]